MVLKRITTLLNKRPDDEQTDSDTPEANASKGVRLFCESGSANSGEEVLHLPTIVEAAVASPLAAAAAATQVRKFLSKDNHSRPHVQYNAIMLIRILADNPGASFTKNFDQKFVDTIKTLLRQGRDMSVQQILRETLDALDREKAYDTHLNGLFAMWRREQGIYSPTASQSRALNAPPWSGSPAGPEQFGQHRSRRQALPPPTELSARIEEARTSAKLLLQLIQSTPPSELLSTELVKEFGERCQSAQRSMQMYISCDSPPPDDDTMLTLIETNEQLSLAVSKHQRAILQARKNASSRGVSPAPPVMPPRNVSPGNGSATAAPTLAPITTTPSLSLNPAQTSASPDSNYSSTHIPLALQAAPLHLPPSDYRSPATPREQDNPFSDEHSSSMAAPPPPPVRRDGELNQPGYSSTPSYLRRQESSDANRTMHGARNDQPPQDGVRGHNKSSARKRADSDVSPIETRAGEVTYRY